MHTISDASSLMAKDIQSWFQWFQIEACHILIVQSHCHNSVLERSFVDSHWGRNFAFFEHISVCWGSDFSSCFLLWGNKIPGLLFSHFAPKNICQRSIQTHFLFFWKAQMWPLVLSTNKNKCLELCFTDISHTFTLVLYFQFSQRCIKLPHFAACIGEKNHSFYITNKMVTTNFRKILPVLSLLHV